MLGEIAVVIQGTCLFSWSGFGCDFHIGGGTHVGNEPGAYVFSKTRSIRDYGLGPRWCLSRVFFPSSSEAERNRRPVVCALYAAYSVCVYDSQSVLEMCSCCAMVSVASVCGLVVHYYGSCAASSWSIQALRGRFHYLLRRRKLRAATPSSSRDERTTMETYSTIGPDTTRLRCKGSSRKIL